MNDNSNNKIEIQKNRNYSGKISKDGKYIHYIYKQRIQLKNGEYKTYEKKTRRKRINNKKEKVKRKTANLNKLITKLSTEKQLLLIKYINENLIN